MESDKMERFYEEPEAEEPRTCGGCDEFTACDLEGHGDVGWCRQWKMFVLEFTPVDAIGCE